ncbi:hypothetical protein GYB29_09810 [bacterium]|nr:hypothetical protein [bacterium]
MKKLLLVAFCIGSISPAFAQDNDGSLGIGFFKACPMNEFEEIGYDEGFGMNLSFMSKRFSLSPAVHFNWGLRMDFASMDNRDFEAVPINTPVPDMGDMAVHNSMYGFFGTGRLSFGTGRFTPYAEALIGHRNFNTKQVITAQNPGLNPEYEAATTYNKVVYTKRFHYGGSLGVTYKIGSGFYLESAITYTEGHTGAVMPLKDIEQNEAMMNYNYSISPTDMLLINVGVRFRLGSSKSNTNSTPRTRSGPPAKTQDRYRDTNTNTDNNDSSRDSGSDTTPSTPKPSKKKLEVKSSTKPQRSGKDNS